MGFGPSSININNICHKHSDHQRMNPNALDVSLAFPLAPPGISIDNWQIATDTLYNICISCLSRLPLLSFFSLSPSSLFVCGYEGPLGPLFKITSHTQLKHSHIQLKCSLTHSTGPGNVGNIGKIFDRRPPPPRCLTTVETKQSDNE